MEDQQDMERAIEDQEDLLAVMVGLVVFLEDHLEAQDSMVVVMVLNHLNNSDIVLVFCNHVYIYIRGCSLN